MRRKISVLVLAAGVRTLADGAIGIVFKLKNLLPKCTRYGIDFFCHPEPYLSE
jgi:hypothetical protein